MTVLKSVDDEEILGFFQPFYLYASVKFGRARTSKSPSEVKDYLSPEDLVTYALARYTWLHEIRHFHDYFGTLAGISLFTSHLQQVRAFARFIELRRSTGKSHSLPLDPAQFEDEASQEILHGLLRNWRIFLRSTARFVQAFEKTVEDGHHPDNHVIYKEVDASGAKVPTFPLSAGLATDGNLAEVSLFYPIGLEVLIEGNAQALQRSIMDVECPPGLADRLVPLMENHSITSADPIDPKEFLKAKATPYNVTDLLVSKYLRLKGHLRFQRESIVQLTDQALSRSFMFPLSKPWEVPATFQVVDIGKMFVDLLENSSIEDLVAGTVPYSSGTSEAYQGMLNEISKSKKPEDLTYEGDFLSPIDMIEAVVAHHITAPLIRARLETKHEVFHSIYKYMEMRGSLPEIPVIFDGKKEVYAEYMSSPSVGDAWTKYCMITSAMHEFYASSPHISCFRAKQIPQSGLNLCQSGNCSDNIAAGRCEPWPHSDPLPDCVFATFIRRFGLTK